MNIVFRVLLAVCALTSFWFVIHQVRKAQLLISDSISWIGFGLICVVLAVFPQIAVWMASILGIQSPVNLVYLVIIGLMMLRVFKLSLKISQLETRVKELSQNIAIKEYMEKRK